MSVLNQFKNCSLCHNPQIWYNHKEGLLFHQEMIWNLLLRQLCVVLTCKRVRWGTTVSVPLFFTDNTRYVYAERQKSASMGPCCIHGPKSQQEVKLSKSDFWTAIVHLWQLKQYPQHPQDLCTLKFNTVTGHII